MLHWGGGGGGGQYIIILLYKILTPPTFMLSKKLLGCFIKPRRNWSTVSWLKALSKLFSGVLDGGSIYYVIIF